MGRGKKSLLSDPGSELRLRRGKQKEKGEDNREHEQNTHSMLMLVVRVLLHALSC